jgi:PST family polysaccharide transporter
MSLRSRVLRGGVYLFVRQGLGMAIGTVGVVLLTRTIGPGAYGLYGAAFAVFAYLAYLSEWGVGVYLVRREGELQSQDYHQAFSLLLLLSLLGAGLAFLALPFIERWVRLEGFGPLALVMFAGLPVHLLSQVPLARLERALDFRSVALVELSIQIIFYLVALPLAYLLQLGPWAPVGGWWAQEILRFGLLYRMSAYRPRLYWESARARAMVGYGLGFSASNWVERLRDLVNPLVVGRYAGAEAVGYVALTIRILNQLSFVKQVAWRLSIATLARLQEDRTRLMNAVTEGTSLQLMALGPLLIGFGLVSPWIIPLLFGPDWLPVLEIYPFLAVGQLAAATFMLYSSSLYVLRRNWEVAVFHFVYFILFAGAAFLLIPYLGLSGYGWAEIAALPSYFVLLIWVLVYIGRPNFAQAGIWFAAWTLPLFSWQLGPWVWVSVILPLMWPATRRELLQTVAMVLRTYKR